MMTQAPERYVVPGWTNELVEVPAQPSAAHHPAGGARGGKGFSRPRSFAPGEADQRERGVRASEPARILIVDDDGIIREAMRDLLEEEGFAVVGESPDGADGLVKAKDLHPDVVLMDLRMPRMGGIEATEKIKNVLPDTQVIVITAYDDPALKNDAIAGGAYCFLPKGSSAGLILDTIHAAWTLALELRGRE